MSPTVFATIIVVGLFGSFCTLAVLVSGVLYEERISRLEDLRRQQELQTLLRSAQIERLQAQIEPHFLFNTLNVLARLAYMNRGREAADGLYSLSRLLRASVTARAGLIPLREELELTRSYLSLQRLRFGDRLTVAITVPEGLWEVLLPPLTIQPLVENACQYAVEHRTAGAEITVTAWAEGERVRILVRDNGPDPEVAASVRELGGTGIGIANVRQRLEHWFGPPFGVTVSTLEVGGTEVVLLLPLGKEETAG